MSLNESFNGGATLAQTIEARAPIVRIWMPTMLGKIVQCLKLESERFVRLLLDDTSIPQRTWRSYTIDLSSPEPRLDMMKTCSS